MKITKFGHSCVRIEHSGEVVVIDPGVFTPEQQAVEGATAVLVTHAHADHWTIEHLRAANAPVYTIAEVADEIAKADPNGEVQVTVVQPGQEFNAGLPVRAVGQDHAQIHSEIPRSGNCGFVVSCGDSAVYHPGDSFDPPDQHVDLLCIPVAAAWCKLSEVLDFAREVNAPQNLAIHDAVLHELAETITDDLITAFVGETNSYVRLASGQSLPALTR